MPDKEHIRLWVDALRSGEYKQGMHALAVEREGEPAKYCCLGVACEVAIKNGVEISRERVATHEDAVDMIEYDESSSVLPPKAMRWLGLGGNNPYVQGASLAGWNDGNVDGDAPLGFEQIADMIEKEWL